MLLRKRNDFKFVNVFSDNPLIMNAIPAQFFPIGPNVIVLHFYCAKLSPKLFHLRYLCSVYLAIGRFLP